ncbi:hypothetical protein A8C32_09190 [Flavivirga aquatica]|uniref:Uncharacterized protein n=1 Tax=Flavivirga aquatica TaxID=1849968 RepID=A0A1E5SJN8_9FLAO|nr:hypothetical protein [Flavivirga aquatica]OEJ99330.1 hypothetical protein A8C32_09190 [Flavivirga aquatica]
MTNFFKHKMRGKSPIEIAGLIVFGTIFIAGLAILLGFIIMWLWNWLMPEIFGLTTLTYWQSVGIFILFKILLGGCGSGSKKGSKHSKSSCKEDSKSDFNKWKHYDEFWKEEGDLAYKNYVERIGKELNEDSTE